MRKIIKGVLLGFSLIIVILISVAYTNDTPILSYVYSDSMEPLIKVNDAFIVLPDKQLQTGDIIMYRPLVLQASYITHRIVGMNRDGYITKGDNSPSEDQDSGEPAVDMERIIGKVVTFHGQPLILPGLGRIFSGFQSGLGKYARNLSLFFLGLGIITAVFGSFKNVRRLKSRHRYRLRYIYRVIAIIAAFSVVISLYLGSGVSQVKYLVSEYPGKTGDQVEVDRPGKLAMNAKNYGIVPTWMIIKGIEPLGVNDPPEYIRPYSETRILIDVLPQHKTGIHQGYIQIYKYPVLLPRTWVVFLHRIHPVVAVCSIGTATGIYFTLLFVFINRIPGFEGWLPLRAIKDKIQRRRMKHVRAEIWGRRKIR